MKDKAAHSGRYAVLFGGAGYEHSVSRLGAENFISAAMRCGFDILPIFIDKNGDFYVYSGDISDIADIENELDNNELTPTFPIRLRGECGFFTRGKIMHVELAVPLLHGDFGEDGRVQGLLASAGIKFVGADTLSGALTSDKAYTKAVADSIGVPTLPYMTFTRGKGCTKDAVSSVARRIGYPAFVKPCGLGSSVGASCAMDGEGLLRSLELAFAVSDRVIVERALMHPRELECAYFDVGGTHIVAHPAEISVREGFYDYDTKYFNADNVTLHTVADLPQDIAIKIREYTEALASALSVRHIARFDFFLSASGELYFNEVNTFPGMTKTSLYSAMLDACGIPFESFIEKLLLDT